MNNLNLHSKRLCWDREKRHIWDKLAAITINNHLQADIRTSRNPPLTSSHTTQPPNTMADTQPPSPTPSPPIANYIFGFLLIGLAWGFTTPFIRAAARTHKPPHHPILETNEVKRSRVKTAVYGAWFGITDLLRNWRYAVPLLINLTGSLWFFLLIGQAGEFSGY